MQSSHFENLSIAPSSRVSTLSISQRVDATVLFQYFAGNGKRAWKTELTKNSALTVQKHDLNIQQDLFTFSSLLL